MERVLPEWQNRADRFQHSTMTWPEACMAVLLTFFTVGNTLAPRTVSSYLSAVKKYLEDQATDIRFFNNSQYIRNTKQGLTLAYRMRTNRTTFDETRLPITADMILLYHKVTFNDTPTPQQRALFVAQLTEFTMVARVFECLYTTKSTHWLSTERVQFKMPNGAIVSAQHAHKHAHTRPTAVHINIKTRKNDQQGRGHTLHFYLVHPTDKYCYVSEMWTHNQCARHKPNCPFFAIPSEDWISNFPSN